MTRHLSAQEAYKAMFLFIEEWNKYYECDELKTLLGVMSILPADGLPADQALWSDWTKCVNSVIADSADTPEKPWVFRLLKK